MFLHFERDFFMIKYLDDMIRGWRLHFSVLKFECVILSLVHAITYLLVHLMIFLNLSSFSFHEVVVQCLIRPSDN